MESPADEQVKKHGATALLFLLLSLLAAGPSWGSAQSATSPAGAQEFETRCTAAAQRATSDKSKPDQPEPSLDCVAGEPAVPAAASVPPVPASFDRSGEPARSAAHSYQARAPPAG